MKRKLKVPVNTIQVKINEKRLENTSQVRRNAKKHKETRRNTKRNNALKTKGQE